MAHELEFKVGQRVWSFANGWGTVSSTSLDGDYPIEVKFDRYEFNGIKITHTKDGRERFDENRVLFFQEIPIPKEALKPPRWRAAKDSLEQFYFISGSLEVFCSLDDYSDHTTILWKKGNYFQTREECERAIVAITNLLFEELY